MIQGRPKAMGNLPNECAPISTHGRGIDCPVDVLESAVAYRRGKDVLLRVANGVTFLIEEFQMELCSFQFHRYISDRGDLGLPVRACDHAER
jgi:hypothetical protein